MRLERSDWNVWCDDVPRLAPRCTSSLDAAGERETGVGCVHFEPKHATLCCTRDETRAGGRGHLSGRQFVQFSSCSTCLIFTVTAAPYFSNPPAESFPAISGTGTYSTLIGGPKPVAVRPVRRQHFRVCCTTQAQPAV